MCKNRQRQVKTKQCQPAAFHHVLGRSSDRQASTVEPLTETAWSPVYACTLFPQQQLPTLDLPSCLPPSVAERLLAPLHLLCSSSLKVRLKLLTLLFGTNLQVRFARGEHGEWPSEGVLCSIVLPVSKCG